MTADRNAYLHLWDLRFLRSRLTEMGLDLLSLPPLPPEAVVPEPPPIREVTVAE